MGMRKAVDYLCLYDPEFDGYAQRSQTEWGGSSDICEVKTLDGLKAAISGYSNIKFLEVALHGTPGMIHFSDEMAMKGDFLGYLTQGTPFLQAGARILFDNCSIGKGSVGDSFMDGIGSRMLIGKGGIVGASTVDIGVYWPKFQFGRGVHFSSNDGRLKVYKYDTSGNRSGSMVVDAKGNRY
jgi:hypothetical protein